MRFIIVPGLDGSDHDHWQSAWESNWLPNATRITPASWTQPDRDDWINAIDQAVDDDVVLITHSLGCLAATHWLTTPSPVGARGLPGGTTGPTRTDVPAGRFSTASSPSTPLP